HLLWHHIDNYSYSKNSSNHPNTLNFFSAEYYMHTQQVGTTTLSSGNTTTSGSTTSGSTTSSNKATFGYIPEYITECGNLHLICLYLFFVYPLFPLNQNLKSKTKKVLDHICYS
ncbi:hypothetical protein PP707_05800, partial [Acetobacter pasteurianus]|nr:hypothetical protein [Acetobacter pasteurianus]